MTMPPMESIKPMNDAEIEAAVRAELPWLLNPAVELAVGRRRLRNPLGGHR
jgi:hypothetical protein